MTIKEAIEYFQNHQEVGNEEQNEAVNMAISALRKVDVLVFGNIPVRDWNINELTREVIKAQIKNEMKKKPHRGECMYCRYVNTKMDQEPCKECLDNCTPLNWAPQEVSEEL